MIATADERYIVVRNWERFQHPDAARSSVPPWVKLYTELLSDEAYLGLTPTRRSLLLGLWLEYARTRRRLPEDTRTLSRRLAQRVLRRDLESLSEAGFIAFSASDPASNAASNPARLEERREDKDPLTPATSAGDASRNGDEPDDDFPVEPVGTMVEAALGIEPDPTAKPCLVCGTPVRPGYRCPNCNANPRTAGSSTRQVASRPKTSAYQRAESYVRFEGWQYDVDAVAADLDRFALTTDERASLLRLREDLIVEAEGF